MRIPITNVIIICSTPSFDLQCSIDVVKNNLKEFDEECIYFYPGWIPERFDHVKDRVFSFVHIDVDLYEPTLHSLRFFYPRMEAGGIILCDDYGFTSCPGATAACDLYFKDKQEMMISLPCGGGFIIRSSAYSL